MKTPCYYHPTQQAHFECYECHTNFCPKCVSKRKQSKFGEVKARTAYFCPKCNLPVQPLQLANIVAPFWKRLPNFFAYPLKPSPLLLILALSIIYTFFPNSMIVQILVWAVLIKYSYAVLIRTGQGKLEPPVFTSELITDNFSQVFKQYLLFVVLGGSFGIIAGFWGPLVSLIFAAGIVIFFPAMIMILVTNDSLVSALNPVYTVSIVSRIGGRYFLMHLFLLMLLGAPLALAGFSRHFFPGVIQFFVYTLARNYYTIVSYNLMGYVLLQYHDELGYEVNYEDFEDQKKLTKEVDKGPYADLNDEIGVHIAEERYNEAIDLIEDKTRRDIKDRDLSLKYYNLLKMTGRFEEMVWHGKNHLGLFARESDKKTACSIYKECLAKDPQLEIKGQSLYKIAGWLSEQGDYKHSANGFIRFIKDNPESMLVPDAYMKVARILFDKLNDKAKTVGILKMIIKKFPEHEVSMDARSWLEQIAA